MDFLAKAPGQDQGKWVLAIDGGNLLVEVDKKLVWFPAEDCEFVGVIPPNQPKPVMLVPPPQAKGPELVTARDVPPIPFPPPDGA